MCGRFASARKRIELLEEFGVQRDRVETELREDYNVAPTKPVYAVLTRHSGEHSGDKGPPGRQLRVVRWGLVPYWAKDPSVGSRMINARAETVAEKPAYRRAFERRRCLLPADGFYEWQQVSSGAGKGKGKGKQPYYIYRADGGPLAFAGLYELWRDRSVAEGTDGAWLWTATIITTSAADEIGQIHDRMPMVIDPAAWQEWLDPDNTDVAGLRRLLVPAMSGGGHVLTSHPVSTAVNNVRNNGPELVRALAEPAPAEPVPAGPAQAEPVQAEPALAEPAPGPSSLPQPRR